VNFPSRTLMVARRFTFPWLCRSGVVPRVAPCLRELVLSVGPAGTMLVARIRRIVGPAACSRACPGGFGARRSFAKAPGRRRGAAGDFQLPGCRSATRDGCVPAGQGASRRGVKNFAISRRSCRDPGSSYVTATMNVDIPEVRDQSPLDQSQLEPCRETMRRSGRAAGRVTAGHRFARGETHFRGRPCAAAPARPRLHPRGDRGRQGVSGATG